MTPIGALGRGVLAGGFGDDLRGAAELEELYQAVRFGTPIVHDGRWGEATLEVCLAFVESARTHAEVPLSRQSALPT